MLYAVIMRFDSLREIMPSIQAEARKLCHFSNILFKGVERHPKTGKKRVSRNLVGIIFYTRKVLLTSHYEKRLFEYASQPRVAGSDIRLLSYLWS